MQTFCRHFDIDSASLRCSVQDTNGTRKTCALGFHALRPCDTIHRICLFRHDTTIRVVSICYFSCNGSPRARVRHYCSFFFILLVTLSNQIVWAVRDAYVGNTFFDANASAFFLPSLSACGKSREVPIPSNSPPSPTPPRDSPSRLPRVSSSADSGGHNSGNSPVGLDVLHTQPEVSGSPRSLLARGPALGIMDGVKVIPHGARSATDDPARAVAEDEVAASSGPSLGPAWLDALNIPACPTQSGAIINDGAPHVFRANKCRVVLLAVRLCTRICLQTVLPEKASNTLFQNKN